MLVVDDNGDVFTSGEDGYLFEFAAKTQTVQKLSVRKQGNRDVL